MPTKEEILEFATTNNLIIHPDRDLDYFISLLNSSGGKCPCDEYRICPCQQSVTESNKAVQENRYKEACCACYFLVTPEFIEAWELKIETPTKTETKKQKQENTKWEITTPKVKDLVETFEKATKLAAKGNIDEAADILTAKADETECIMCQGLLENERIHMDVLGSTCKLDKDECEIEKQQMKEREKRRLIFLAKVDEYSVKGTINGKNPEDDTESENDSHVSESLPEKKSNPYHTCLKTMPANMPNAGALPEYETRVRFAIASKMCAKEGRNEPTGFESELETYREEHPEFFTRGE
jgi:hypothetical protein